MLAKVVLQKVPVLNQVLAAVKREKSLDVKVGLDLKMSPRQITELLQTLLGCASDIFLYSLKLEKIDYRFSEDELCSLIALVANFSGEQLFLLSGVIKNKSMSTALLKEAKAKGWRPLLEEQPLPEKIEDWAVSIQNLVARDGKNSLTFLSHATSPKFVRMRFAPNSINTKAATIESMSKDLMIHLGFKQPVITSHPGHVAIDITLPEDQWTIPLLSEYCPPTEKLPLEITIPVGIGVEGEIVSASLEDPRHAHWLVGAVTGAGKSVWLRQAICALLRYPANRIRITIIDFKTEGISLDFDWLKQAGVAVKIITNKTEARHFLKYVSTDLLGEKLSQVAKKGYSSVAEYNAAFRDDPICWDAIFIDEYADIKVVEEAPEDLEEGELTPRQEAQETESSVGSIAAKGRAGGISEFLCTQRPSVDVVTGVLKGNLPATIALKARSEIDSRVILGADGPPAHQLLGKGDLFFQATDVQRCQSLYIGVKEAIHYVKEATSNNLTLKTMEPENVTSD